MEFSTSGIVIKEQIQGENDKLLTILSPMGKIFAYAKGVKKMSSKNAPACQLFAYSEFEFIENKGRTIVKSAVAKEIFFNLRADMSRYSLSCYFAEVINRISTQNNDENTTMRLFLNTLFVLSNKSEIPLWFIKGAFELKLMCICGFMPNLENCYGCGCEMKFTKSNYFSFEEGGILCEKCKNNRNSYSCTISENVCHMIKFVSQASVSGFIPLNIDDAIRQEYSFICENYLIHKTEQNYETLRIYKSIINSLGEK